jgi:hypothetical protein
MRRPDLARCTRGEAREYIEHLEAFIEENVPGEPKTLGRLYAGIKRPDDDNLGGFVAGSSTSRKAALDNYPRSGSQRFAVLAAIAGAGEQGMTRDEAAVWLSKPINSVTARITELVQGGFVRQDDRRTRKTRNGSDAAVLVLTEKGHSGYVRTLEGLPAVAPTKADGSPAALPQSTLFPPASLTKTEA